MDSRNPHAYTYAPVNPDLAWAHGLGDFFRGARGLCSRADRASIADRAATRRHAHAYGVQRIGTPPTARLVLGVGA